MTTITKNLPAPTVNSSALFIDVMRPKSKAQDGKSVKQFNIRFKNRLDLALFLMELRDWRNTRNV